IQLDATQNLRECIHSALWTIGDVSWPDCKSTSAGWPSEQFNGTLGHGSRAVCFAQLYTRGDVIVRRLNPIQAHTEKGRKERKRDDYPHSHPNRTICAVCKRFEACA